MIGAALSPVGGEARSVEEVVETSAKSAVDEGLAVGVAAGITRGGRRYVFGYGRADVATGARATPDTIFQIGSVTKVFITALLGQNTVVGINSLAHSRTGASRRILVQRRCILKAMANLEKSIRQSVSLPPRVARRVKALAKTGKTSANRVVVALIEAGLESKEQEKRRFFDLADRLARSSDPTEQERLKEELARMTFGE